jgi:hypothetical protein
MDPLNNQPLGTPPMPELGIKDLPEIPGVKTPPPLPTENPITPEPTISAENKIEIKTEATPAVEVKPEVKTEEVDDFTKAILDAPPPPPKTMEEKREEAAVAMQGPELAAKHEAEGHLRALKAERATIKTRLEEIAKIKEQYELAWVKLDEARVKIKTELEPITTKEQTAELNEDKLEASEDTQALPKERRVVEEERWAAQTERHQIEQSKWAVEERLMSAEEQIEQETKAYRNILDEEDKLLTRLDQIEDELTA